MAYPPCFIIGNPRSGTTLLRLILNAHSHFCVPPECGFIQWLYQFFGSWTSKDSANPKRVQSFLEELSSCRKIETWELNNEELGKAILTIQPDSYTNLCREVLNQYIRQEKPGALRWGDKNNYYIQHMETIETIFPDAVFLFIVRDGRDVACSYRALHERTSSSAYFPKLPYATEEIAREWKDNNQQVIARLSNSKSHLVKYEDLVVKSENTIRKMCSFLDIPFESGMLEFYLEKTAREPHEMIAWKEKTQKEITSSQIGRFHKDLSEEEIESFEIVAGKDLRTFGYQLFSDAK